MQISQDQLKTILKNKPLGSSDRKILEGLIDRGYNIDGLDSLTTTLYREQKRASQPLESFQQEKPKSFWGKARDIAANIIGGGKLAEAAGQAISAPGVMGNIEDALSNLTASQTSLLEQLRNKRVNGEDTSRIMEAINLNQVEIQRLTNTAQNYTENLVSNKQVVGSSARLAGTLAGGAIASKASQLTGVGQATTALSGAARGAGAGIITGATEGAIQGAGIAAEKDMSTQAIVASGLLGSASGAAIGGALGGVTGAVGGTLRGRKLKKENFVKELVSPKQTQKVKAEALRQGRFEDPSFFKKAGIQSSKRDEQLANAIDDVVRPEATLGENIDAIKMKVTNTNSGVRDYITNNKTPFNTNQLKSKLLSEKSNLDLVFASDATAERTYDAVMDAFMKNVGKKDTLGLFEARQNFDQVPAIRKLLETQSLGENTRKEIVLAVRRGANEYIAQLLPKGNQYRNLLMNESYALEALGNIAEKGARFVGKNKLQILTEEYPIVKWIVGGLAAGALAGGGVGVGSTIVGSSD